MNRIICEGLAIAAFCLADRAQAREDFKSVADLAERANQRVGDILVRIGDSAIDQMFDRKGKTSARLLLDGPNGARWVDVSIAE